MSDQPKRPSWAWMVTQVPAALLCVSLLVNAGFVFGSFVTYAPSVDATAMQNIYLTRIVHYGSAIALLNALAILSLGMNDLKSRAKREKPYQAVDRVPPLE
jgi:hypothetical protein